MNTDKKEFIEKISNCPVPSTEELVEAADKYPGLFMLQDYLTNTYSAYQHYYRALFGVYFFSLSQISKVDEELLKRGHLPVKKEEMDFYQKYDLCGSVFLYLRGWIHIERLSEEELEILKGSYEDLENEEKFGKAFDMVSKTYSKVLTINSETPDEYFELYPSIRGEGVVKGDSIVFSIKSAAEFDENGMYADFEQNTRKRVVINNVKKQLERILTGKLNQKVIILQED